MTLHPLDIAILLLYLATMIVVGFLAERRASGGISQYFLGKNEMPWWVLSMSNAASMFDISGTIWLVSLLYVYGLKSVFIPWLWPVFNQIFMMVYLSAWLRRSGAITGAEWITLRFGNDRGAEVSRISVVIFALVSVVAFTAYAFVGIAKFSEIFLPDTFSPNTYAIIIVGITTLYTVVGGLYSVVITDLIQFAIMVVCGLALGGIAMWQVSPEMIQSAVPAGWTDIRFAWMLDLNWDDLLPAAAQKVEGDGYSMFGAFFLMMVFKGVLVSAAGPAPNYDMQRVLAAKTPKEASLMSGLVTVVLFFPRYFMVAGITVLALAFMRPQLGGGDVLDFEQVLPIVIRDFVPIGLAGLLIAGLLAAFMSTFAGTINAAAAYLVNDVYKRYVNPDASEHTYIRASYLASLTVVIVGSAAGYFVTSVEEATQWIVSALWGGYAAPNILKWHWWRLNGYGYFWGMISGIAGAIVLLTIRDIDLLFAFPVLFGISAIGSVLGSLLTAPGNIEQLTDFYAKTRPWGWWQPICTAAQRLDPNLQKNKDFLRDAFNVVVGVIWQTAFIVLPIYLVTRSWFGAISATATVVVTSLILKFTWYNKLESSL